MKFGEYIGWQWRNFFILYLLPAVFPSRCGASYEKYCYCNIAFLVN